MAIDRERILQSAQKHVEKKRFDRAIEEYQRIVQYDPNDARTLLKIGDLQARMHAYRDAVATYERVGQYYATQGFALKAIAVYKQVREIVRKHAPELDERYAHILPRLAEIYTQLGLTSDALAAWDEVATRLQRQARDRDAIEVFRRMIQLDRANPLPYLRFAEACCRVQAVDEAINSFWAAAELLLKLDRRDDALKVIERILHFRPDPRFARVAAELYLQRGRHEDGLQALSKLQICFQADPRNLDTLNLLALAFTSIGQQEKAVEVFKEMARLAREQGRVDMFQQLVAHLMAVAPHDDQVRALQSIPPVSQAPSAAPPAASVRPAAAAAPPAVRSEPPQEEEEEIISVVDDVEFIDEPELEAEPPPRPPRMSAPELVVSETDEPYEAVAASFEAEAQTQRAIIDAESFRRLRLYGKAVGTLRQALEVDPRSRELRQKLREILAESGDRAGAIAETLTLAAIWGEDGNTDEAELLVYEVLEVEPHNPTALHMAAEIGRAAQGAAEIAPPAYGAQQPTAPDYEAAEPLPSYDLEEVRPSRAMGSSPELQPDLDDPFAAAGAPSDALPSVPLPETDLIEASDLGASARQPLPSFSDVHPDAEFAGYGGQPAPAPSEAPAPVDTESLEAALEEADFFSSRGLVDDARAILQDQLSRTPRHPLVLEKLRELDEQQDAGAGSRTIDITQLAPHDRTFEGDEAVFDIAASLEALDELPAESRQATGGFASIDEEVDVDAVFAKFKEGVSRQVDESDSATHYDLGVAYKEMGLVRDAIGEFEIAARDPARECMCHAMVGLIHLEQNELDEAAEAYKRALNAQTKTVDQEMSLYYDLGNVYEMKSDVKEALYYFQKIARRDPGYRDVKERIAALEPDKAPPMPARAVNDDDEFDRAFDELFKSS